MSLQIRSSHFHFTEKELVKVTYVNEDKFEVWLSLVGESATSDVTLTLNKRQLQNLHASIGLMLPPEKL